MLPKIVERSSKNSSIILRLIAKYAQQNRREMLFYNFKYIFSYLLRTISKDTDLERCLHYLQVCLSIRGLPTSSRYLTMFEGV